MLVYQRVKLLNQGVQHWELGITEVCVFSFLPSIDEQFHWSIQKWTTLLRVIPYPDRLFWHSLLYICKYIWNMFWHSIWHCFWHMLWHNFWHSFWHSTWHLFWHSLWHLFWHIFWHSLWHSFWQSIWHSIWDIYIYIYLFIYIILYICYIYILSFYLALSFWWSVLAQPDPELAMGSGPCPDCTGQLRLPLVPGKGQKCQGAQWHMWRIWHPRNLRWEKPGTKLRKVAAEEPMLYAIWLARCLTVALATS